MDFCDCQYLSHLVNIYFMFFFFRNYYLSIIFWLLILWFFEGRKSKEGRYVCLYVFRCNDQYRMQLLALMQGSVLVTIHMIFGRKVIASLSSQHASTWKHLFVIINFLISKNQVGSFGCEWVALGFKADTSITLFSCGGYFWWCL